MFPSVAAAGLQLSAPQTVLDGEIVAVATDGSQSFKALQHRDLLFVDGQDLTGKPLVQRRSELLKVIDVTSIRLSVELPGSAQAIVQAARQMRLEGVVAKQRNSR